VHGVGWIIIVEGNHLLLLNESIQSQMHRNPVAMKPIMFTQIGNIHDSTVIVIPVTIRRRCKMETNPKIVPATRQPKIFESIILV
jgi:hypothetical protein